MAFGQPAVDAIGQPGDQRDRQRRPVFALPQPPQQRQHGQHPRDGDEIGELAKAHLSVLTAGVGISKIHSTRLSWLEPER